MIINGLVKTARGNHVIGIPLFILVPAILAGLAAIWRYKSASQDTTADSANLNKNQ